MVSLSKKDVATVDKLIEAVNAVLSSTYALAEPGSSSSPAATSSSHFSERQRWAELCCVWWRVSSLQKSYLFTYISPDPLESVQALFRSLTAVIQRSLLAVKKHERLSVIASLGEDHLTHFLAALCDKDGCRSMLGDEDGDELFHANCSVLAKGKHVAWMSEVYAIFCEEVYRRSTKSVSPNSPLTISLRICVAVQQVLLALRTCSADKHCSHLLLFSEPSPYVMLLLHGIRLRLSKCTCLSAVECEEEGREEEAHRGSQAPSSLSPPVHASLLTMERQRGSASTYFHSTASDAPSLFNRNEPQSQAEYLLFSLDACRSSAYAYITSLALDVVVEAVKSQQCFNHCVLLPTLSSFSSLCAKELQDAAAAAPDSSTLAMQCEGAVAVYENLVLILLLVRAMALTVSPQAAAACTKSAGGCITSEASLDSLTYVRDVYFTEVFRFNFPHHFYQALASFHPLITADPSGLLIAVLQQLCTLGVKPSELRWLECVGTELDAVGNATDDGILRRQSSGVTQDGSLAGTVNFVEQLPEEVDDEQRLFHSTWMKGFSYTHLMSFVVQKLLEISRSDTRASRISGAVIGAVKTKVLMCVAGICWVNAERFERLEGREILKTVLKRLRREVSLAFSGEVAEDRQLYSRLHSLSILTCCGLDHLFFDCGILATPEECQQLTQLPLLFFVTQKESDGGWVEERFFTRIINLWRESLDVIDSVQGISEAFRVMIELFHRFTIAGRMPKDRQQNGRSSGRETGGEDGVTQRIPNTSFSVSLFDSMTARPDALKNVSELDCVRASDSTIFILKAIFSSLLERQPDLFSVDVATVLLEGTQCGDPNTSLLMRRCVRTSLVLKETHSSYATVLHTADGATSMMLLQLLTRHLLSEDVKEDGLFEQRTSLLHGGCVAAAITMLLNTIEAPTSDFYSLVPVLFRFLAAFEPSQHCALQLHKLDFPRLMKQKLEVLSGVGYHWCVVRCAIHAALGMGSPPVMTSTQLVSKETSASPMHELNSLFLKLPECCVAEKTVFLDVVPASAAYMKVHCSALFDHLVDEVLPTVFRATGSISSPDFVKLVLDHSLTHLLPCLALSHDVLSRLPFTGTPEFLQSYWVPALLNAPVRSHIRFVEQGGAMFHLSAFPTKGLSLTAVMRFDSIASLMPLIDVRAVGRNNSVFSIVVVDGDSMQIQHEDDQYRSSLNEKSGLLHFLPKSWIQVSMVISVARTVTMYLNGAKVGSATIPYFSPSLDVEISVGFIHQAVANSAFALSEVTLWGEELTWRQVEAAMAGVERSAAKGVKLHLRQVALNDNEAGNTVVNPIDDRIAHYVAHENDSEVLINVCAPNQSPAVVAKIVGKHATPPKCWVDFHLMWSSRGGVILLLQWMSDVTSTAKLQQLIQVFTLSARHVTSFMMMDSRVYILLAQQLCRCGSIVSIEVADELLMAAAFGAVDLKSSTESSLIVNRLIVLHVLTDPALFCSIPLHVSLHILEVMQRWVNPLTSAFAYRNVTFLDPVIMVERLLHMLVRISPVSSLRLGYAILRVARQILRSAGDFAPAVLDVFTSLAAVLTPVPDASSGRRGMPIVAGASTACSIPLSDRLLRHISCGFLACALECEAVNPAALPVCISLEWYLTCVSPFALPSSVVFATRLLLSAAAQSASLRDAIAKHPMTIVNALRPHAWFGDLPLLLLAESVGAPVDLVGTHHSLLEQLTAFQRYAAPTSLGAIVAPICMKVLVCYLESIIASANSYLPYAKRYAAMTFQSESAAPPAAAAAATAATSVSAPLPLVPQTVYQRQTPILSFRFRCVASLVKACCCLMVAVHHQRYGSHGGRSQRPSTAPAESLEAVPVSAASSTSTNLPSGEEARGRNAGRCFSVVRVSAILFVSIMKKRCSYRDRGSVVAYLEAEQEVMHRVVRQFREVAQQRQFFSLFVAAPTQSSALTSLFSLISLERMEVGIVELDEKMKYVAEIKQRNLSHSLSISTSLGSSVPRMANERDGVGSPLLLISPGAGSPPTMLSNFLTTSANVDRLRSSSSSEDVSEGEDPSDSLQLRSVELSVGEMSVEEPRISIPPSEDLRSAVLNELRDISSGVRLTLAFDGSDRCTTQAAMGEKSRREAFGILASFVELSLCCDPPSHIYSVNPGVSPRLSGSSSEKSRTEWVGGERYGGCGGLLLKLLCLSSAASPPELTSYDCIRYFLHKVSSFIMDVFPHEGEGEMAEMLGWEGGADERSNSGDRSVQSPLVNEAQIHLDIFLKNVTRFTGLVSTLVSVSAVSLPQVQSFLLALMASSGAWPMKERAEEVHRCAITTCLTSIRRPLAGAGGGVETLEATLTLLRFVPSEYYFSGVAECVIGSLYPAFMEPSSALYTDSEFEARRRLITSIYAIALAAGGYGMSPGSGATSKQSQFFSRWKGTHRSVFLDSIARICFQADNSNAVKQLEEFFRLNAGVVETFLNGKYRTASDGFVKEEEAARKEYVARIKQFSGQCSRVMSEQEEGLHVIQARYLGQFSSYIEDQLKFSRDVTEWLALPYVASGIACGAFEEETYHFVDTKSHYGVMRTTKIDFSPNSAPNRSESVSSMSVSPTEGQQSLSKQQWKKGPGSAMRIFLHDAHISHMKVVLPALSTHCKPYMLHKGDDEAVVSTPPFIHPSIDFLTPSAWTMVRRLLGEGDQLRYIGNAFHVYGLSTTPCLILLSQKQLLLISFSRLTEKGDIILFERDLQPVSERRSSVSSARSSSEKSTAGTSSKAPPPFSFAAVTRQIHRFLVEDRQKKVQEQMHRDGSKVAQAVRQTTRHTFRELYWSYLVSSLRQVTCLRYMHLETAVHLQLHHAEGPMLALMDAQGSMTPSACAGFVKALKSLLKDLKQDGVVFYENKHRAARMKSMLMRWATGSLSNMEYLLFLNGIAGRTAKDFNQFPVFPWVISDYTSDTLNFDNPNTYRRFGYPIGAQTEARRAELSEHYTHSQEMTMTDGGETYPFHHGIHYSTSGGLLYFLLRAEPFTTFSRLYFDGSFDRPSRLFCTVSGTFSSCVSVASDSKELIPIFFGDAFFLENADHYAFGCREDGTSVNDVVLPPWAKGSVQVFSAIMRYALESEYVVNHLHEWIDLVFGIRRRGPLAVEVCNVFRHMTYGEEVVEALNLANSPQDCDVIISEVDNFGQAPRQLFTERHPEHYELAPQSPGATTVASRFGYKEVFDRSAPLTLQIICSLSGSSVYSTMRTVQPIDYSSAALAGGYSPSPWLHAAPQGLVESLGRANSITGFVLYSSYARESAMAAALAAAGGEPGSSVTGVDSSLMALDGRSFFPSMIGLTAVEGTDYYIGWHEQESCLMRFRASDGCYLSMIPFSLPDETGVRMTVLQASCRETVVMLGSEAGGLYALFPDVYGHTLCLHSSLHVHTHPIVALIVNSIIGRVVSVTAEDDPALWRVMHCHVSLIARLPVAAALQGRGSVEDRLIRHACIDERTGHIIVITQRFILMFDSTGKLYGQGPSSATTHDSKSQAPLPTSPMSTVTLYHSREWASGIQLLLVGHDDGTLTLWRVTRLPPAVVEEEKIVVIQFHGTVEENMEVVREDSQSPMDTSEAIASSKVTALHQIKDGEPQFLVGYESGLARLCSFAWKGES